MTDRQEILLCAKCLEWIKLLQRVVGRITRVHAQAGEVMKQLYAGEVPQLPFEDASQVADHLEQAALIFVILTHIRVSCKYFQNVDRELKQRIEDFTALYESKDIRNVRNVIEHLEEYIVGEGKNKTFVIDIEQHLSVGGGPKGDVVIGIFGRRYDLTELIQNAFALYDPLFAYREKLAGR